MYNVHVITYHTASDTMYMYLDKLSILSCDSSSSCSTMDGGLRSITSISSLLSGSLPCSDETKLSFTTEESSPVSGGAGSCVSVTAGGWHSHTDDSRGWSV